MVPNHPRYQLRYTRIFDFLVLPLWSNMWSNGGFRSFCGSHEVPKRQCLQGVAGFRILPGCRGCYTLPKLAPYQLGYTRICGFRGGGGGTARARSAPARLRLRGRLSLVPRAAKELYHDLKKKSTASPAQAAPHLPEKRKAQNRTPGGRRQTKNRAPGGAIRQRPVPARTETNAVPSRRQTVSPGAAGLTCRLTSPDVVRIS